MIRFLVAIILSVAIIAWFNPEAGKTKDGNRLYKEGLYDDALAKYTEVLIDLPDSPRLHLNVGNSNYKKEDYETAIESYTRAASLALDPLLEGKAYYNIGNCKYRQGRLKENTDVQEAVSLYREALDYYKQSLDRKTDDTDAKYNHEFVERRIKELLDAQQGQQQQQEGQESQQQQQEGQQQGGQQHEGQQQQDQQQGEMGEQQEGQEGDQQEQQGQKGKSGEDEKDKAEEKTDGQTDEQGQQDGQQGAGKRRKLTQKEARMLLDSLKDEELQRPDDASIRRRTPQVLKDW